MTLDDQAKKTLSVGLFIAVIMGVGFGWWHFSILKLHYKRNETTKTNLNGEIKKMNDTMKEIRAAEAQRDQIEQMRKVVLAASERLPSTPDAPGFLQELINILRITGVQPQRVDPLEKHATVLYTDIPYKIECQGRYHEFGQFLNLIEENQTRFMRVKTFTIKNNDKRPSIHPVTVNISTFMFNTALSKNP